MPSLHWKVLLEDMLTYIPWKKSEGLKIVMETKQALFLLPFASAIKQKMWGRSKGHNSHTMVSYVEETDYYFNILNVTYYILIFYKRIGTVLLVIYNFKIWHMAEFNNIFLFIQQLFTEMPTTSTCINSLA